MGAGGWGTALAILLGGAGRPVRLLARRPELAQEMIRRRENPLYLPGARLPESVTVGTEADLLAEGTLVLVAVPCQALRETLQRLAVVLQGRPVVLGCKGLELDTGLGPAEVAAEVLGSDELVGVLSGPNHAEEVARGLPAAAVVAGGEIRERSRWQELLTTPTFRVYGSDDRRGVELGGALKNVLAIAVGIAEGLELGDNAKAALLTRGMAEMARLGESLGGERTTFYGLSGLGDLVVTGLSRWSRNRRLGEMVGRGLGADEALRQLSGLAVEGWPTARVARELAVVRGVSAPVITEVYEILYAGKDPRLSMEALMTRGEPGSRREG